MAVGYNPKIVTSGMVLALDAANMKSYDERVNSFTYSEDFTNAAWVKSSVGMTGNATTGPTVNGVVLNADKITETAVTAQFLVIQNPYTAVAGDVNTISVYAKASERTQLTITSYGEGYAVFNLDTGTVYQTGGHVCSIIDAGNGWYRCSATITEVNVTASSWYIGMWKNNTNVYAGTAGQGLFIAGAQFDRNRNFASRYVKTVAAGVSASTTWSDISGSGYGGSLLGATSYSTLPSRFDTNATLITEQNILSTGSTLSFADGTAYTFDFFVKLSTSATTGSTYHSLAGSVAIAPWLVIQQGTNPEIWNMRYRESNGTYWSMFATNSTTDLRYNWGHLVAAIDTSRNINFYYNGVAQQAPTAVSTAFNISRLAGGYFSGGTYNPLQGSLASCKIYNRTLSASEVLQNFNALRGRFGI
jgi:hypothetical protein